MKKINAVNFLLYTSIGVTLDDGVEEIVKKTIRRAYRDASSHVLSIKEKNTKEKLLKEASIEIQNQIKGLLNEQNRKTYADWHKDLCGSLLKIYREEAEKPRGFTYGIAQKWVNMTMKYLAIIYSIFKEYKFESEFCKQYEKIESYEKEFDIPIDRYILEGINKTWYDFDFFPQKGGCKGKYSSSILSWSKWNDSNDYEEFQCELKKKIKEKNEDILDWEGKTWISIAKDKNK